MKRKAFLKLNFGRLALTFLLLCLIIYTCYHAVGNSAGKLLTTPARTISDVQLIGGDAWLFRDETLLAVDADAAGLVNSVAVSGSKVAKQAALTEVWSVSRLENLEQKQAELDRLNRTVSVLEASMLPEGTPISRADGYQKDAMDQLLQIRMAIRSGDWSRISQLEDGLLTDLNRYGILTGDEEEIKTALATAKAERDALLTGTKQTLVNEESSAYYYGLSEVDGYETLFTEAALEGLTAETFAALKTAEQVSSGEKFVVGKLCYGYSWRVAVEFSQDCLDLFLVGGVYRVTFPENDGLELDLTCERLMNNGSGGTVAVLRSDVTPASFRYLRMQKAEITVGSLAGIYVPEQSYVSLNGVEGVYVFEESAVRFRRIRVLYRGDGYLIANLTDTDPDHAIPYLGLNDLMITSGKNLYDGKVYP